MIDTRERPMLLIAILLAAGWAAVAPEPAESQWRSGYRYSGGPLYGDAYYADPYYGDPYTGPYYYPGSRTYFGTTTPLMFPGGLGYEYNFPGGYYDVYPQGPFAPPGPRPRSALQIGPNRYEYWR